MPSSIYLFPLIGALIGYSTNYLAVRMIFRPRRPRRIGPFRLQGLVPRRKAALAASIGDVVEAHLVSHEDINRILNGAGVRSVLEEEVDLQLGKLLEGIAQKVPMASMFLQGALLDQIRAQVLGMAEQLLAGIADQVEASLDVRTLIRSKIEDFDLDRLESIVLSVASRELRFIELAGAALGALVGTVQLLLVL